MLMTFIDFILHTTLQGTIEKEYFPTMIPKSILYFITKDSTNSHYFTPMILFLAMDNLQSSVASFPYLRWVDSD